MELPVLIPMNYQTDKPTEYGRYLVVRKDGKKHLEIWNNTGWAYNNKVIVNWYYPKIS